GEYKAMGTRPRASSVQENPKKPPANELLIGSLVEGGSVSVTLDKEKNQLAYQFLSAEKRKAEGAVH
ncbi:hypothetical protein EHS86_19110, partial [Erwinia amylovora]|uniref:hypothetical protein n=1 Tax=Erwinia amylovora TaxID=552 RepID=UPI00100742CA